MFFNEKLWGKKTGPVILDIVYNRILNKLKKREGLPLGPTFDYAQIGKFAQVHCHKHK